MTMVAVSGPPWVSTNTASNTPTAEMTELRLQNQIYGFSMGSLMCQKTLAGVAPST